MEKRGEGGTRLHPVIRAGFDDRDEGSDPGQWKKD
ncbi:hypothetical protein M2342_003220 [Sphingobium sp. B8D3A]|nr:hypothetical protein [Sphingobium sp. B8D3A]